MGLRPFILEFKFSMFNVKVLKSLKKSANKSPVAFVFHISISTLCFLSNFFFEFKNRNQLNFNSNQPILISFRSD